MATGPASLAGEDVTRFDHDDFTTALDQLICRLDATDAAPDDTEIRFQIMVQCGKLRATRIGLCMNPDGLRFSCSLESMLGVNGGHHFSWPILGQ